MREKDPAIYYEYWLPRQTTFNRMTVDAFASDAQQVVSARPTQAPTPTTTRPVLIRRTGRTTTEPTTTTTASSLRQQHNNGSPIDVSDWDQYEPQPTAASLVRSPPRMTYGHIFAPFFTQQQQTTTSTTTTQRTTTTTIPSKKVRNNKKNIQQVRQHLGLIHKKHQPKSVRSGTSHHGQLSCSVDGSCWKTVNGKKHFCLSEFGINLFDYLIRFN